MKSKKMLAWVLSASLVLGAGAGILAKTAEPVSAPEPTEGVKIPNASGVPGKEETVYVLSDADGSVNQVLVSNWLQNPQKAEALEDRSSLENIENVKGNQGFSRQDGKLFWEAQGEDIYYQGTTDQAVPVSLSIHYTLDGQEIQPEALAGQSGTLTMRLDYENHATETVTVNGKSETVPVPFAAITGVLLDTEHFRNVEVQNGRLENLGNQMVILGLVFPGMQEQLSIDGLEIPDFVEISAEVEDFTMGPTMTLVTADFVKGIAPEDLNPDAILKQVKALTDGADQLLSGSKALYDGLNTLLDQAGLLVGGVQELSSGATQLQAGVSALNGGAAQLQAGAAQLSGGLSTLDANSAALVSGAEQVFASLLSAAETQLRAAGLEVPALTVGNYDTVLRGIIASLDETAVYEAALQKVTAGVEAQRGTIEKAVTEAVYGQVLAQVTEQVTASVRAEIAKQVQAQEEQFRAAVLEKVLHMTVQEYEAAVQAGLISEEQQKALETAVAAAMEEQVAKILDSEEIQEKIAVLSRENAEKAMEAPEIQAKITENTELQVQKAISETMASAEVQAQLAAAAEGAKSVIALKSSLDSYNGFYLGLQAYTAGVSGATAGAKELIGGADALKGGMDHLSDGIGSLASGISTIQGKSPALLEGITQLRDGAKALQDGFAQLMQEGIQKLADLAQDDLQALAHSLSGGVQAAQQYDSFSGKAEKTPGTVKFIIKTASVE